VGGPHRDIVGAGALRVGTCRRRDGSRARLLQRPLPVSSKEIAVRTGAQRGLFDLTPACDGFLREVDAGEGLLNVFVPHATAGVVIMELGAGSDHDLMATLDRLLPRDDRWVHRHGSAGHGADHVLPLLVPPSVSVPVVGGRLALGAWQSIALLDPNPDNATRQVRLTFVAG
jgi:secondary thiamine-phosphate synthase enzyme